jgi:hypothetical protein
VKTGRNSIKFNFPEYRKILTGKIDYDVPNRDINNFVGYLKLRKDPKI